ncbi:SpaA isopeptide-forming pilin-related protein [Microbacterium sp. LWO12-1.2]|uniref:DUF7927 domain-containing protein n=1 Tax=Microbacterium sp. LWO12-1.2 TaxID=3135261 RepID=UPI00342FFAF6
MPKQGETSVGGARRVPRMLCAATAILAIIAIAVGMQTPLSASADPTSNPSITITALSPASQPSGTAFGYRVSYTCSNINASPCAESPTVTIPLGAASDPSWTVAVGANPLITSWSVTGGDLVVQLADLTEGVAGTIGITITPPNHTTPNGTTWTLVPTMTFPDGTPTATAPGVTSTATATAPLTVSKTVEHAFYTPGDTVRYTLRWSCSNATSTGHENTSTLRLVDTLPAGLTFVSSTPAASSVSGQTVTFDLTSAQVGTPCVAGAPTPPTVTVVATVNAGVADNTVLRNTVAATATSISGAIRTPSAGVDLTVVQSLPGATATKRGYGPLVNTVGDSSSAGTNGYRSATAAGPWLGRGIANTLTSNLTNSSPLDFRIEAMYTLDVVMPTSGLQSSVVDPMPCTTNVTGATYSSYAPGTVCTDPAFHATMVTVRAGTSENAQNVGIPTAFAPLVRLTDGTTLPLTVGPVPTGSTMLASGPSFRSYFVPAAAIGQVAEIILPRTDGMTNARMTVMIGGYADEDRVEGDILRNQAVVSSYEVGESAPYATTTPSGRVFILDGPQIGMQKAWSSATSRFLFTAETFFPEPTTGDLTFVDRFPAGVTFTGPVTVQAYRYSDSGFVFAIPATVTNSIDPQTGETVVTVVVTAAAINARLAPGVGDRLRFELYLPVSVTTPGTYTNTAAVTLSDPAVDDRMCITGTKVAGTVGAAHQCAAPVTFTINPNPSSDAVRVSKSVRGSLDTSFKTFPAIGYVAPGGGNASYRLSWTNKSAQNVGGVVAYDLLPRVSDTGTVAGTVNQQRGSTFRPILTGLATLPAGITASYSTAVNPCRPQVLPNAQNPGCVDDWTTLPASPSAPLLQSVTALRFTSTATYAFDQGFTIELSMTTPPLTSPDEVAWNTFATAQTNLVTGQPMPPVESAKVGIARQDYSHITIDKVVDKKLAGVGDTLTYTVTAVNDGGRDLDDITLRDTLPAGVTFVSASGGGVHAGGVITWQLADMPLGQLFTFTVTARVAQEGATLVNRWGVDGTTPVTPLHPCPEPNTAEESCATTEVPTVPLTFAKTATPAAGSIVKPGDTVTYAVTVTNGTAGTSTTGEVTDDMSEVLDKATLVTPPAVSCAPITNSCGRVDYSSGDTEFTWRSTAADPLAGNTVATITYTVRVADDASGTLRNLLVEPDIAVEHPISGSLRWDKVDDSADARLLAGAEWTLQRLDGNGLPAGATLTVVDCTQAPCGGPDEDADGGRFLVPGLVPGGYQLIETKAPIGFVLDTTPRTVLVHGDTQVTVLDDIVNRQQPAPVLPFTGGIGTDHLLAIGAVLLLLTAGLAGWRRTRRHPS